VRRANTALIEARIALYGSADNLEEDLTVLWSALETAMRLALCGDPRAEHILAALDKALDRLAPRTEEE
jgi:hypothetical protein